MGRKSYKLQEKPQPDIRKNTFTIGQALEQGPREVQVSSLEIHKTQLVKALSCLLQVEHALSGELDQTTYRSLFQTKLFCDLWFLIFGYFSHLYFHLNIPTL